MIKMWRSVLSCFLVAIAISCGKHSGQLGIQSREKTALQIAAAEKNAAAQPSKRSKRKKQSRSPSWTKWAWTMWAKFYRSFMPIYFFLSLLQVGQAASAYNPMSCALFQPVSVVPETATLLIPFPLNLPFNESNARLLLYDSLNSIEDSLHPEEVRRGACHLFADRDVDITVSASNTTLCRSYLTKVRGFFSNTIRSSITSSKGLWSLHFERVKDYLRNFKPVNGSPFQRVAKHKYVVFSSNSNRRLPHHPVQRVAKHKYVVLSRNSIRKIPHYPRTTLVEKVDGAWYFHIWRKDRGNAPPVFRNFNKGNTRQGIRMVHYLSPQSQFHKIIKKYGKEPSKCINKLQAQGAAILSNENLDAYCDDPSKVKLAEHLISVGGEFLYVADYNKSRQPVSNYLKKMIGF
ncbi:hypothetical protein [Candidatus Cardinium hertigii]|uniref:Uncharacterized protein n=1 Tax=Candidatus Cardinium hertigii TaxID=247481 RepID=A0A2Z3LHW4_9BACT|nr:hypothetical protein [Candidatus Cardinium hertigii]AWN82034.1 hypothetical protein DK880_00724 [Candidatus Cardinium hertigii]